MANNFKTDGTIKTGAKKKIPRAKIRLAEAILSQALEDLWIDEERTDCIDFFSGEGFRICSEIVGMSSDDKVTILTIVGDIIAETSRKDKQVRSIRGIRADRGKVYELVR